MSRATGKRDPLVYILPARLEEARKAAGLSVSGLARKAGVRQQTVDAIGRARSGKRRCRQSIRDRLAKALDLPTFQGNGSRWLGGDDVRIRDGSVLGILHPSRADLPRLRLIDRCRAAWARDRERPLDAVTPPRPPAIPEGASFRLFEVALDQLTNAIWWRNHVYATMDFPPTRAAYEATLQAVPKSRRKQIRARDAKYGAGLLWDEMTSAERERWLKWPPEAWPPALTDEAADRIELGFVSALEGLLEPWLSGEAEIRYEWLVALQVEGNRLGRAL